MFSSEMVSVSEDVSLEVPKVREIDRVRGRSFGDFTDDVVPIPDVPIPRSSPSVGKKQINSMNSENSRKISAILKKLAYT